MVNPPHEKNTWEMPNKGDNWISYSNFLHHRHVVQRHKSPVLTPTLSSRPRRQTYRAFLSQTMGAAEKQNLMMKGLFLPEGRGSRGCRTLPSTLTQAWLTRHRASVANRLAPHCSKPEELRELALTGKTWGRVLGGGG